jgi:hypothetical protein
VAKLTEQVAIVLGVQVGLGTILASVQTATIVANTDDGAVLSANEALGILFRSDSLTLDFARLEDDPETFPGTFSKVPGSFLRSQVEAFSFDVTVKGGGKTVDGTPSAGDYNLPEAIEAVLKGFGLNRGTPTTADTPYNLGDSSYLTFKVWRGAQSWTIQDCIVSQIEYKLTPSETVVATITVQPGAITFDDTDTFPTSIDYGFQTTLAAPVLKAAGAAISPTTRGFLEGTLTLALAADEFPDSNAADGLVPESSARLITWDGDFYVDSTDPDQDWVDLIATSSFPDLSFTLGVHVVGPAQQANALGFLMNNVDFTAVKYKRTAGRIVYTLAGYATNAGAGNDEFVLTSK